MVLQTSISKTLLRPWLFSPHGSLAASHPSTDRNKKEWVASKALKKLRVFHRNIFTPFTKQTDSNSVSSLLRTLHALSPPKAAQADTITLKQEWGSPAGDKPENLAQQGGIFSQLQAMTPNTKLVQQVTFAGTYFPNTSITEAGIPGE